MNHPDPLTKEQIDACFRPHRSDPIKPGAFELGMCLGGTVSAGAYTGGALDFLIEALDAWTRAKEDESPDAPPHEVVISTIAGASGGAINGAILLRGAGWEFDHGAAPDNPFYSSWTSGVDLMQLLGSRRDERDLGSLFNCRPIADQAAATIRYSGRPLGGGRSPRRRSYLADPLRLMMMVGNVTGLPYSIPMGGESGLTHDLVAHADLMRFALTVEGGVKADPPSRPDELALSSDPGSPQNWDIVRDAALATSAFPLAFQSRPLTRPMEQCRYRVPGLPGAGGRIEPLVPNWDTLERGAEERDTYDFVNVDGGTFNNEPLDVVRTALSGLDGRNPREPNEVNRAVVLIDPFSDPEALGPRRPPGLAGLLMPFVMSLINQARYKPADIALAYEEGVYSRYLIAPAGPGPDNRKTVGKAAIASGGLGGFLGFVDMRFLRYDYALGRRNAHGFLARHLALPEDAKNPLFDSWTAEQRNKYRFFEPSEPTSGKPQVAYLPLIPLMGSAATEPGLPEWPTIPDLPPWLSGAINTRLDTVFAMAKRQALPNPWWRGAISAGLALPWRLHLRPALRDFALDTLRQGLVAQKLLRPD